MHNDPYGQPMISLEGGALRNGHVKLSMSDDGDYAIAFVTLHT
ncbi:putative holo-(acyl-carrier-protein) synthase [Anaplasma phagocytophilum str. ApNYW]|nr:putative holo-(acyl-carrier-protein) synthase [Anaplasma phagocytophilum str. ApNYW]